MQLRLPWSAAPARAIARDRRILIGGRDFPIAIVRHRRARRYIVRVTPDGMVRLTVPRGAGIVHGLAFVERERAWIAAEWERLERRAAWAHGTEVWYRGERVILEVNGTAIRCAGETVTYSQRRDVRSALLRHWRLLAQAELPPRCLELAGRHGLRPASVQVRDQQSRWGACSGRGRITLNWRLVQMPPDVADYVILHELAHLRQPNHSRRFWREVESLCPEWRVSERWLKTFGRELL